MKKNLKVFIVSWMVVIIFIITFYTIYINSSKKDALIEERKDYVNNTVEEPERNEPKSEDKKTNKEGAITITVLDKVYNVEIKDGDTLYKVMENLRNNKENNFSFNSKEYPSLGIYIDEINGVKEDTGKYWIYYINGKEASMGVSKYFPQVGDIISWKQE